MYGVVISPEGVFEEPTTLGGPGNAPAAPVAPTAPVAPVAPVPPDAPQQGTITHVGTPPTN